LPKELQQSFQLLGQATLPLGLLAVGAGLELHHFQRDFANIIISSSIKLLIFPSMVLGIHLWFQLECQIYQIALLFAALPTAPSAYILARQMGGDAELMANIVSVQIILSLFSLPWILWLATC
jgi:predicted permease